MLVIVTYCILANLNHMLMVGVPIAKGTLGEDGDVGENVEKGQASPHVCCRPKIVGAKKRHWGQFVTIFYFNLLKTTMKVRSSPTAMKMTA